MEIKVIKIEAPEGFIKARDLKKGEKFEFENQIYVTEKAMPKRGGNAIVQRLSDGKRFKMTPWTNVILK